MKSTKEKKSKEKREKDNPKLRACLCVLREKHVRFQVTEKICRFRSICWPKLD